MRKGLPWHLGALACLLLVSARAQEKGVASVTVPVTLDHNRMLVEAEVQRKDGTWRKALLWVDTGNPDCILSEAFARDLGLDLQAAGDKAAGGESPPLEVPSPGVRIGGMSLDFQGVRTKVLFQPKQLFQAMHNDGNLPSTVLMRYHVVFDYPAGRLTLAAPGSLKPRGEHSSASVNPKTGILQIDAVVGGEKLSFAMDNGASYSFASREVVERLCRKHPKWPRMTGAVGCANIWGWWPEEAQWPVVRVPQVTWGAVRMADLGLVGLPDFFGGSSLGAWYSKKTARPVDGFLGPNAFKAYRVEIDYVGGAVYFEKGAEPEAHDLDLVGITLCTEADGGCVVVGVAVRDGKPAVGGVRAGDKLVQVGDLKVAGATMGAVVDALRGKPGQTRTLLLEREGKPVKVEARVERFL